MTWLRWLTSSTVRQAVDFAKRVDALLNEQRDLLETDAIRAVSDSVQHLRAGIREGVPKEELKKRMELLESTGNRQLIPYPNPAIRENVKEVLVAVTVILSITTFFIQLTKIPTGSLQPTLYGITTKNLLRDDPDFVIPGRISRFFQYWIKGVSYCEVISPGDGPIEIDRPRTVFPFVKKQRIRVGGETKTIWFPPPDLFSDAGVNNGDHFRRGQVILRTRTVAGDHLLVDRFTYNFRRPKRGEIFVFKTEGIRLIQQPDVLYIKRLVALGGEEVQIGDDRHLRINDVRLDASTPHFENVYSFDPAEPPQENQYSGHVNDYVASLIQRRGLAPLFPTADSTFKVPEHSYLAMGDNTLRSSDSRYWGPVPDRNVTGKALFVYWPISKRFGIPW